MASARGLRLTNRLVDADVDQLALSGKMSEVECLLPEAPEVHQ
jgi:hypothetical protein